MTAEDRIKAHRAVAEYEFAILGESQALAAQEGAMLKLAVAREKVREKGLALAQLIPSDRGLVVNDHCYAHSGFYDKPVSVLYVGD